MESWITKELDIRTRAVSAAGTSLPYWEKLRYFSFKTKLSSGADGMFHCFPEFDVGWLNTIMTSDTTGMSSLLKSVFSPNQALDNIPSLYLYEFEPQPTYQVLFDFFNAMKDLAEKILPGTNKKIENEGILTKIKETFKYEKLVEATGKIADINKPEWLYIDGPLQFYTQIIAGTWLGGYELPYFGGDFLQAKGREGWTHTDIQERFLGNIKEILSRFGLGGINIPWIPEFQVQGIGPVADEITVTFHLFNDTLDNFIDNWKFLTKLGAGAHWVQSGLLQRGSNFYQVRIPGRMVYYLCGMDFKAECIGKSRVYPNGLEFTLNINKLHMLSDIFKVSHPQIPDGYQVTLTLQSIIPNTFNAMLFSLVNHKGYFPGFYGLPVEHWAPDFVSSLSK